MKFLGRENELFISTVNIDSEGNAITHWTKEVKTFEELGQELRAIEEHTTSEAKFIDVTFNGEALFSDCIEAKYDSDLLADSMMEIINITQERINTKKCESNAAIIEQFNTEVLELVHNDGGYRSNLGGLKAFFEKYSDVVI